MKPTAGRLMQNHPARRHLRLPRCGQESTRNEDSFLQRQTIADAICERALNIWLNKVNTAALPGT